MKDRHSWIMLEITWFHLIWSDLIRSDPIWLNQPLSFHYFTYDKKETQYIPVWNLIYCYIIWIIKSAFTFFCGLVLVKRSLYLHFTLVNCFSFAPRILICRQSLHFICFYLFSYYPLAIVDCHTVPFNFISIYLSIFFVTFTSLSQVLFTWVRWLW